MRSYAHLVYTCITYTSHHILHGAHLVTLFDTHTLFYTHALSFFKFNRRNPTTKTEPVLRFSDSEFLFEGQKASVEDLRFELLREGASLLLVSLPSPSLPYTHTILLLLIFICLLFLSTTMFAPPRQLLFFLLTVQ